VTNDFNKSVTQRDFCACFVRAVSEILVTVVERDPLRSSLAIDRDRYFVLWSSLRTLPHTEKYFEKVW